jgi:hypothetical protein
VNFEEEYRNESEDEDEKYIQDEDIVQPEGKSDQIQIKGYVRDSVTRAPIPNSKVIAINRETNESREIQAGPNTSFQESGYYELNFDNEKGGIYDICVEKDGYFSLQQVIEISGQQGLNFFLFKPF